MIGRIVGTGVCVPSQKLTNHDISKMVDTSDEWIRERTGIQSRYIAKEEANTFMAVEAARKALEDSGILPEELDMIVVSTISPDRVLPCMACEVQAFVGAHRAICFDLNAACSGFLFAYQTVQGYMQAGMIKKALIIGSEKLSGLLDWSDRGSCILFGDGAGAAVMEAVQGEPKPFIMQSDGSMGDALICNEQGKISMDGRAVFEFAVRQVPVCIEALLEKTGESTEDVDFFLLHQANQRIIEAIAKRLHTGIEKFPINIASYGNVSSASIPILLDELRKSGTIKEDSRLVMAAFGAGLSWGAAYVNVSGVKNRYI